MVAHGLMKRLGNYNSPKLISFPSVSCVSVKFIMYLGVVAYICYAFIVQKRYQEKEELTSAVRINLKGVAYADRIWDAAEYTMPMQSRDSFFVMTNIIKTENQLQQTCPEYPIDKAICSSDKSCEKGSADVHGNGVQTGRCVQFNETYKTCEIMAWCPIQKEEAPPVPAVLRNSEDFTVLIKNNIHFPTFNYTTQNISPKLNISCKFNKVTSPLCPIFRLGDIIKEAKENYSEMAVKGGIIAIEIKWDCNLDSWSHHCSPEYSFRRLDDKTRTHYTGFSFKFARHYKLPNETEHRTLFKAYGIRFDVLVFGMAGKFNVIEFFTFLGSTITYFGLAVTVIEICFCLYNCSNCCKIALCENVIRKKYEAVLMPEQVVFVSHVDEPQIAVVKIPLKTSLQNAKSSVFENHFVKSYDPRIYESSENHSTGECELRELTQNISSSDCPKWCNCGRCNESEKYHEQLCCRKTDGQCITTTRWFMQLVLSRDTLNKALLYEDPFLDLTGHKSKSQLRRVAYKQYIHWRFGSFDLEDRAIIPNCCRKLIRNTYPNADGKYTGFNMD
ncbi:P2X purinoceptor 7 [Cyrtonyx montezumae]|uniref:P2X purinoceptor 7 n=1 Tax=Cyrtonyx montezumae TaxID=9017 RepID=UPI0032D9E99D